MQTARHWRLNAQRYTLQGATCPHCSANIFPPREVCPFCANNTQQGAQPVEVEQRQKHVTVTAFSHAAR